MSVRGFIRGGRKASDAANQKALPSFADDSYLRRLAADVTGRTAEQPSRIASSTARSLESTAKVGGATALGGGGLYVGHSAFGDWSDLQSQENREKNHSEYQETVRQIMQNENLSPEERQEALKRAEEQYQNAQGDGDSGGLLSDLRGRFNSLGMVEKAIAAVIILMFAQSLIRRI